MSIFFAALGLMLMFEGLGYALFPDGMKRAMQSMFALPSEVLRRLGLGVCVAGFILFLWAMGGF